MMRNKSRWGNGMTFPAGIHSVPLFEHGLCVTVLASPAQALWLFLKGEIPWQPLAFPEDTNPTAALSPCPPGVGFCGCEHCAVSTGSRRRQTAAAAAGIQEFLGAKQDHSAGKNSHSWCTGWVGRLLPAPAPHFCVLFPP